MAVGVDRSIRLGALGESSAQRWVGRRNGESNYQSRLRIGSNGGSQTLQSRKRPFQVEQFCRLTRLYHFCSEVPCFAKGEVAPRRAVRERNHRRAQILNRLCHRQPRWKEFGYFGARSDDA